jgi:hypothetical protein
MRNSIYLLFATLLLCSIQLQAQTLEEYARKNGTSELRVNGIVATFSPFTEGRATTEGILRINRAFSKGEHKGFFNILINRSTGKYIGYAILIDRLPDPAKLKLTIIPIPREAADEIDETFLGKWLEVGLPNRPSMDVPPLPLIPEPKVIGMNDVVKIPLWISAGTEYGVIGDQIRFAIDRPRPARDFTLDDVPFKLVDFRLFINGELRSGEGKSLDLESVRPSIYVPGKGLFILSIKQHEGHDFQKLGVVEGNKISFSHGGDKYEWVSREPVITQRGTWNLWVLLDPNYQPSPEELKVHQLRSKGNCCVYTGSKLSDVPKSPQSKK